MLFFILKQCRAEARLALFLVKFLVGDYVLTDSTRRQQLAHTAKKKKKPGTTQWWGDSQKIEAVKTYLILGNLSQTGRTLGVPEQTIRGWKATQWWREIEADLKLQDELVLSQKMKGLIGKTLDLMDDRLQNGDFVFDQKTGQMRRKPINARDLNKIAQDAMDRQDKLESRQVTEISQEATADKLMKLAQKFAELAGAQKQIEETIDVETVEISRVSDCASSLEIDESPDDMAEEEQPISPGFSAM